MCYLLLVSRTDKACWKQILDHGGYNFSCKSVPQRQVYFMVCKGNTKAPMKMANVYSHR